MREITYIEAINEAMIEEMERDEKVFIMGEDIAVGYGGGRRRHRVSLTDTYLHHTL